MNHRDEPDLDAIAEQRQELYEENSFIAHSKAKEEHIKQLMTDYLLFGTEKNGKELLGQIKELI